MNYYNYCETKIFRNHRGRLIFIVFETFQRMTARIRLADKTSRSYLGKHQALILITETS